LKSIPLNKVPAIAHDEPLLKVLDRFQEGRSHIAIVTRLSSKRAASVKEVVKPALTRRFLNRFRDSDSSSSDDEDLEKGKNDSPVNGSMKKVPTLASKPLEQTMPADALLPRANVEKLLQGFDPYTSPVGIITLEDVLEELIGEEIYDEFDLSGPQALPASTYLPPEAQAAVSAPTTSAAVPTMQSNAANAAASKSKPPSLKVPLPKMGVPSFGGFGILRSRSAPGTPRGSAPSLPATTGPAASTTLAEAVGEKLEHIKEVNTPSPTEMKDPHDRIDEKGSEGDGDEQKRFDSKGDPLERASTLDSPPVYGPGPIPSVNVEPVRSSSTPPSPVMNKATLSSTVPPSGTATPTPSSMRTAHAAPSLLTEAVLRGRQARLAASQVAVGTGIGGADGTATPNPAPGPRPTMKGRFKSRRLEGAPPSPPLIVPKDSKKSDGPATSPAEDDKDKDKD